ncbi:MAG: response regulator [Calditrichae bacterium]|nr:response regulator [Calditrichia bacterium]
MENLFSRVENLDELIRSVKLPYFAWKVLFCIGSESDVKAVADLLESDEKDVQTAVDLLISNGLVNSVSAGEKEAVADPQTEDLQQEEQEAIVHTDEEPEMEPETEDENIDTVAEEIEDEISTDVEDTEEYIPVDDEDTVDQESEIAGEEEFDLQTEPEEEVSEDILDELVEDAEEFDEIDTDLDDISDELDIQDDQETEEKIEINIPEGEDDDSTEDLEFNFNLTGDDVPAAPVKKEEPKPVAPVQDVDTSGYKKILVIDDSLVIRKMVEIALEEEEFKIETAVSGKEGLEIMDQTNPDLVILDMMLPDINGIEILKTIKASKGIPVIMLSGKDSPQMIETAKNEGAEEFLPKPFKDDDLVDKIKKLLND